MKAILILLSLVLTLKGATYTSQSVSYADVNSTLALAGNGDVVNVPAGSATWSTPLVITKCVSLIGAGTNSTTITGDITDAYNGVISVVPDSAARAADQLFRVSGFTVNANNKSNGIYVSNDSATPVTKVRIDHNYILNAGGESAGRGVYILGSVYGVADHNRMENFDHGMDNEGFDHTQWDNLPIELGTAKNFYFEDNVLTSTKDCAFHAGGHGGRYVARYNSYTNLTAGNIFPVFDMHGNSPPDLCGMMVNEIYGNEIDFGAHGGELSDQRGGTLLEFFNRVKWGNDQPYIEIREEYLDSNYPPGNSYPMHVRNSYYWNNQSNGNPITSATVESNQYENTYDLTQNVDFWFHNPTYNGTTQVGIFVGSTLPSSCSVGDGAWITSQSVSDLTGMVGASPATPLSGVFYKCISGNVWTLFYTPYTYPHPLQGSAAPSTSSRWLPFFIGRKP